MATAAYDAARPIAWYASAIASYATYLRGYLWLILPVAISVYFVCMWEHKKKLGVARVAFEQDGPAYREFLDKQSD
ncbi:hypothetical protein LPB72_18625 [Hydrogenophaga crassostreae]|uniref:Uncharacterized protein n=1 Tax=Hydrogenophaga crassostreae TaxID=1763535 RepID=A0A167H292_9BURK|nr:hypothetical protein LPB072_09130 [Hydrogenophaga crassostreae]OAD40168.1 hypothetical protein LPB72_18625 [Hydrogenophaga crassostreae]